MKIVVIQSVTSEIAAYTKYAVGVNAQYCIENDYEYRIVHKDKRDKDRHPSWNRVRIVADLIQSQQGISEEERYDWIVVIDADAVIQDRRVRFEVFIKQANADEHILICDDIANGGVVNCGVMIFKNTTDISYYLDRWWNEYPSKLWSFPYEQAAFVDLLKEECFKKYVKIFPIDTFNSHWQVIPEDIFIAHFMAQSTQQRIERMKPIIMKMLNEKYI